MEVTSAKTHWTPQDETMYSLYRKLADDKPPSWMGGTLATHAELERSESVARLSDRLGSWPGYALAITLVIATTWRTGDIFGAFALLIVAAPFIVLFGFLFGWALRKVLRFERRYGDLLAVAVNHREEEQRLKHLAKTSNEAKEALEKLGVRRAAHFAEQESLKAQKREELKRRVALRVCPEHWQALRGYDLEQQLEVLFSCVGFSVSRLGRSGDDGIDLILVRNGRSIAVQCKGWGSSVGPATVRELIGTRHIHSVSEAWLVAVGGISKGAEQLAQKHDIRIVLADDLAAYAKKCDGDSSY